MKYLALDFETSGKTPGVNQAISLGVAVMDGEEVIASQEWRIGPKRHYKTNQIERQYDVVALQVSGITWRSITEAPSPEQVVREMHAFAKEHDCKELPIVAFNAAFDFSFYTDLLFIAGEYDRGRNAFFPAWPPFVGGWHCAMLKAKDKVPGLSDYKLDTVCAHYGLSRSATAHGALEDCILAGRIYSELTKLAVAA